MMKTRYLWWETPYRVEQRLVVISLYIYLPLFISFSLSVFHLSLSERSRIHTTCGETIPHWNTASWIAWLPDRSGYLSSQSFINTGYCSYKTGDITSLPKKSGFTTLHSYRYLGYLHSLVIIAIFPIKSGYFSSHRCRYPGYLPLQMLGQHNFWQVRIHFHLEL